MEGNTEKFNKDIEKLALNVVQFVFTKTGNYGVAHGAIASALAGITIAMIKEFPKHKEKVMDVIKEMTADIERRSTNETKTDGKDIV